MHENSHASPRFCLLPAMTPLQTMLYPLATRTKPPIAWHAETRQYSLDSGKPKNQFSLTHGALSTCPAKKQFAISIRMAGK